MAIPYLLFVFLCVSFWGEPLWLAQDGKILLAPSRAHFTFREWAIQGSLQVTLGPFSFRSQDTLEASVLESKWNLGATPCVIFCLWDHICCLSLCVYQCLCWLVETSLVSDNTRVSFPIALAFSMAEDWLGISLSGARELWPWETCNSALHWFAVCPWIIKYEWSEKNCKISVSK